MIECTNSPMGHKEQHMNLNTFSSVNSHQGAQDARHEPPCSELEALSYTVSHDLRAPLHMIQNNCEWLNTKHAAQLDPEGRIMLQRITTSSEQMEKLLDGLLALSKAASLECTFSSVDMTSLARGVIDELLQCENESPSLSISIKSLPPAYGDAALLHQVWYNLLSNAFKYTRYKEKRKVEIGSDQVNGQIVYSVSDNGAGFNMQYVDRLFGAFHRLHEIEKFEGTGVGLAIVHQIIRKHNGRIWAEGQEDIGARFYFALPNNNTIIGATQ